MFEKYFWTTKIKETLTAEVGFDLLDYTNPHSSSNRSPSSMTVTITRYNPCLHRYYDVIKPHINLYCMGVELKAGAFYFTTFASHHIEPMVMPVL